MTRAITLNHEVFVHKRWLLEAQDWCQAHLGPRWRILDYPAGRWTCFWAGNEDWDLYRFYFASESDCAWFALKFA